MTKQKSLTPAQKAAAFGLILPPIQPSLYHDLICGPDLGIVYRRMASVKVDMHVHPLHGQIFLPFTGAVWGQQGSWLNSQLQ